MGTARPLYKVDHALTCEQKLERAEARLAEEKRLRVAAERNARRFHALMLKARVELIGAQALLKGTHD